MNTERQLKNIYAFMSTYSSKILTLLSFPFQFPHSKLSKTVNEIKELSYSKEQRSTNSKYISRGSILFLTKLRNNRALFTGEKKKSIKVRCGFVNIFPTCYYHLYSHVSTRDNFKSTVENVNPIS